MTNVTNTANEIKQFLTKLFPTLPAGAFILIWLLDGKRSHFCRTVDEATRVVVRSRAGSDVYVGIGLRGLNLGPSKRGGSDDVVALAAFALDIDIAHPVHKKGNLPPDEATAYALLAKIPLKPTFVVHTGHGLQAWFMFNEPYVFGDAADHLSVAAIAMGWQARLRQEAGILGYDTDNVGDFARVMRIPGTLNLKENDAPVPVRIVTSDGPTYAGPGDFADHVILAAEPASCLAEDVADTADLRLDPAAEPPKQAFEALIHRSPRFKKTWERNRKDLQDQSPSGYDLALARLAVGAHWSNQEAANLLIANRRHHNDPPLLRHDYLLGTIAKARTKAPRRASTIPRTIDSGADASRARLLQNLGLEIKNLIKFGTEQACFTLQLADGAELPIGKVQTLWSAGTFRSRIYELIGHVVPRVKAEDWDQVMTDLAAITETVPNEDATRQYRGIEWLAEYLAAVKVEQGERWKTAVIEGSPYVHSGRLFLHRRSLHKFVTMSLLDRVELADLADTLRALGFVRG